MTINFIINYFLVSYYLIMTVFFVWAMVPGGDKERRPLLILGWTCLVLGGLCWFTLDNSYPSPLRLAEVPEFGSMIDAGKLIMLTLGALGHLLLSSLALLLSPEKLKRIFG
jgi:hypothetical protein